MKNVLLVLVPGLFSIASFAQSDPLITVDKSATTKQVMISVKKSEVKRPPFVNIGPSAYGNEVTMMWNDNDSIYFTYITLIYLPDEPDTIKIRAKDFTDKGGTTPDIGRAAGNTGPFVENDIVGFFNTGDWMKYTVNLTGRKEIVLRFSYGLTVTDQKLEIRKDSLTGTLVAEIQATPTGNWNTFLDKTLPIRIDTKATGPVDLYFIVKGVEGAGSYWGNLDSFEIR